MLLDNLKENDVVVFSDGTSCGVTAYSANKDINIVSIVFVEKVAGLQGYPKKFCWTYWLDGCLWNTHEHNINNIVKVIHVGESETR